MLGTIDPAKGSRRCRALLTDRLAPHLDVEHHNAIGTACPLLSSIEEVRT